MLVKLQQLLSSIDSVAQIVLPHSVFIQLGLEKEKNYTIIAGKLRSNTTFSYSNKTDKQDDPIPSLFISYALLHQLSLYENMSMQIWTNNSQIHLGPIVGVFLNTRYIQKLELAKEIPVFIQNHMLGNQHSNCTTYFFSVHDLNWIKQKIHGYSYDRNTKTWQKKWYPMPDVLYDRGASFEQEHKSLVRNIRQQFSHDKELKTINSLQYLGKWQLYKALSKYSLLQPYLPVTVEYSTFDDVISMLENHTFLFIKSIYGSRGKEIITIEKKQADNSKSATNHFLVTYFSQQLISTQINDIHELEKLIESLLEVNKRYIIQQGIRLLRYEGRPTDTRVLTQKNNLGEWEAVYSHVNIAGEGSAITTINSDDVSYEEYYQYYRKENVFIPTDLQIRRIAITIAQLIENELGPMAEMGLDIAIDENYQVWFFEANSKPEKYPGPGLEYSELPTKQFYNILEYAKYLTMTRTNSANTDSLTLTIKPKDPDALAHTVVPTISIPSQIYQDLLSSDKTISRLCIGQWETSANYLPNYSTNEIMIPYDLLEKFPVLWEMECHFKFTNNTLHLGPVLGIFLSNGSIRKMISQKPRFRHYELSIANKHCGTILYYFSIKDVDFVNHRINGTYYDYRDKRWKRRPFPLPEVFYDRGGGVLTKQLVKSEYIREQLNNIPNLKKINPQHYFDKWLTHKKLMKFPAMTPYLPMTINYKTIENLREMLTLENHLFVKDSFGSNGRGILKLSRLSDNEYRYSYFSDRVYEETVPSIEELHTAIQSFIKSNHLILQAAISLINIDDRNIDLRATMQRKENGELDIVSLPVRMGCPHSPITSTQSGSKVYEFNTFFETCLKYSKRDLTELTQRIEVFLKITYQCIEESYGVFGEIGIDFALDTEGALWFIECNAKPGYDAMYKSYDRETINKTFTNPLQYAKYISNY